MKREKGKEMQESGKKKGEEERDERQKEEEERGGREPHSLSSCLGSREVHPHRNFWSALMSFNKEQLQRLCGEAQDQ